MAVSRLVVTSASSGSTANSITCVSPNTLYEATTTLDPAIYTITCNSSTIAKIEFYSGPSTLVTTVATVSGSVSVNLGTAADRVRVWTDTGTNIPVIFTKTAVALTNSFSGTLDTITSTSTYTGTSTSGYAYAVLVGGGGGGASSDIYASGGPGGGGSGGICSKLLQLTGSMPVTIGAGGNAGGQVAGNGGSSSFAGMTAGGGQGGQYASTSFRATGGSASGGTFNTVGGQGGTPGGTYSGGGNGETVVPGYPFVITGIVSGGAGDGGYGAGGNGASGFGINYGSGGNGKVQAASGAGKPGVLYLLKF